MTDAAPHRGDALASTQAHLECPGCRAADTRACEIIDGTEYWRCAACEATFVDPAQHLGSDEEYAVYLQHRNDPDSELDSNRQGCFLIRRAGYCLCSTNS